MGEAEQPKEERKRDPIWGTRTPWGFVVIAFVGSLCGGAIAKAVGAIDPWTVVINAVAIAITYLVCRALLTLWRSQRR
ncbi:hypothetical protein [Rathayibacter festucae]|uniref:hypothetical protein n=1 Tax=Rathayibacter festucae TaxID=110937 RepID=UPI002A6B87DB|nr:hypothetical protein [Rathayibacter festucae]MDY0913139.1 hypothetical protein [Rathayibacter festucae]